MTDKEKREFKDGVISIFKRFNILDHTATIGGLRDNILRYIDSMQKEPINYNKLNTMLDESLAKETKESWEGFLQEEPKKCMYSKDNYTDKERRVLCEDCQEECEYAKKKVPVSEELEEELPKVWDRETLDEYAYQVAYDLSNDWLKETATWDDVEAAVKLGAKWQRQKDEHLIWQISSANYEKGIEEGKQQIMKDAVEAEIYREDNEPEPPTLHAISHALDESKFKFMDKVRVIIIKDE